MIRHTTVTSQVRFFNKESSDPYASYDAICTLMWETPQIVWITGLHGVITRKLLAELIVFLDSQDVQQIKAYRAPGRNLPLSELIGPNLYSIDIKQAMQLFVARIKP